MVTTTYASSADVRGPFHSSFTQKLVHVCGSGRKTGRLGPLYSSISRELHRF